MFLKNRLSHKALCKFRKSKLLHPNSVRLVSDGGFREECLNLNTTCFPYPAGGTETIVSLWWKLEETHGNPEM